MINIGIGLGWAKAIFSVASNVIANFRARVLSYPNSIFEAGTCLNTTLEELNAIGLLDNASLIVTPNAYNEGALYDVVPNTPLGDMTVVRATTATRVNSVGLVEVVPRNLFTYSDGLIAEYPVRGGNIAQATTPISGFGSSIEFQNNLTTSYLYKSFTATLGATYSISVFVQMNDNSTPNPSLNSSSGDFGLIMAGGGVSNLSVQRVGSTDVYRVSGNATVVLGVTNHGVVKFATQSSKGFRVTGYQLDLGSSATEYFPTTTRLNIPRIDYSNGSCPSLLVEPQRTNLVTYSDDFDNIYWTKLNTTIISNNTTSPNGNVNADKIVENSITNIHGFQFFSGTIGNNEVFSMFLKAGERNWVYLQQGSDRSAYFNLQNGTIGNVSFGTTALIVPYINGWYRCSISGVRILNTVNAVLLTPANGVVSYLGNGTDGIFAWGAQLESGSYPTSYIPTVASAVTRNADVISKTGISSLIGQTEGTMFLDFIFKTPQVNTDGQIGITANAFPNNRVLIWNSVSFNSLSINLQANGLNIFNESLGTFIDGQKYKIAIAYKSGDSIFYVNGIQVGSSSASFSFTANLIALTLASYEINVAGHQLTNSAQIYKTRLSNSELAQLTTI